MTTLQRDRTADDQRSVDPERVEVYRVLRASHPADLIVRRPDLYGVSKLADVAADSVLWSA